MYEVCISSKYGFCKFGRRCEKIHFSDICDKTEICSGYQCDKRHPAVCYYYQTYQRCKFNSYCSYAHPTIENKRGEQEIIKEVNKLKEDIVHLKIINTSLQHKLETFETLQENPPQKVSETITTIEVAETPIENLSHPENNLIDVDLQTIIRESSWFFCKKCDYKFKFKKGLRIHDVKMHSVLRKEVTEYLSRPCAWSKRDENGRTFNYYCKICGILY